MSTRFASYGANASSRHCLPRICTAVHTEPIRSWFKSVFWLKSLFWLKPDSGARAIALVALVFAPSVFPFE